MIARVFHSGSLCYVSVISKHDIDCAVSDILTVKIGVVSDTHGYLDPQLPGLLAGVDSILHAGDVGSRAVLEELERIARVRVVRGNVDSPELNLPPPLILGPDRQRLSKRHGATSVGAYRDQGILPEALVNFLALLGWTPPGGEEILSRDAMAREFDLATVSKSNAVFDPEKLAWMNSQYLRALSLDRLVPLVAAELKSDGLDSTTAGSPESFRETVALLQPRARTLKDFPQGSRAFFTDEFDYAPEARKKFWKDPSLPGLLDNLAERLEKLDSFNPETTEKILRGLAEESGVKAGLLINATRVALTGQAVAPGLFDVMSVLGQKRTVERLRRASEHLREPGTARN